MIDFTGDISFPEEELPKGEVGCGYCTWGNCCFDRDPKINKAKLGCKSFCHWQDIQTFEAISF